MFNGILSIYKKEIGNYFNSLIAYIFLIVFILVPNFLFFHFFNGIFKEDMAAMRIYFIMLPFSYIFFIAGLSMGSWAKERNSGTIELLFTFPISDIEVLAGKFLSILTVVLIGLLSTLSIPLFTEILLGNFDWGQIVAQYIGSIFLACAYIAIALFISSLFNEEINVLLLSAIILLLLNLIGFIPSVLQFPPFLKWLKEILIWTSLSTHFSNFSKGVIDSRDILYYTGVTALFFYLNLRSLESRKWS